MKTYTNEIDFSMEVLWPFEREQLLVPVHYVIKMNMSYDFFWRVAALVDLFQIYEHASSKACMKLLVCHGCL